MDKGTKKESEGAEAAPISTTLSEEEVKVMIQVFSKMGVKPKATTKEEMQTWMEDYIHGLELLPKGLPPPLPLATPVKAPAKAKPTSLFTDGSAAAIATASTAPPTHLEATSTGTIVTTRKPWLVKFSGHSSEGYVLWRHQLRSMSEKHSVLDIEDAIRSSLHGKAGDIVAQLGTSVSVEGIIKKMDSIYGEVDEEEDLLHLFYGAKQEPDETVVDWGCRLETMVSLLKKQGPLPRDENSMLRKRLWKGLREELQDVRF